LPVTPWEYPHSRSGGLVAASTFPSRFDLGVVFCDGLLAQGHTDFLQRLRNKLLHMKAVLNLLRIREAGRRNLRHTRVEIAGDGLDRLSYGSRDPAQGLADHLGFGALDDGDQGAVLAVTRFVRDDGVELSLADCHFIEAQVHPHVLRKHEPFGGMRTRLPGRKVAEMLAVLPHKPLGIQAMGLGNRGQRQRLVISPVLVKKPHTPSPVESQGR